MPPKPSGEPLLRLVLLTLVGLHDRDQGYLLDVLRQRNGPVSWRAVQQLTCGAPEATCDQKN
jgi:hypothetical protein